MNNFAIFFENTNKTKIQLPDRDNITILELNKLLHPHGVITLTAESTFDYSEYIDRDCLRFRADKEHYFDPDEIWEFVEKHFGEPEDYNSHNNKICLHYHSIIKHEPVIPSEPVPTYIQPEGDMFLYFAANEILESAINRNEKLPDHQKVAITQYVNQLPYESLVANIMRYITTVKEPWPEVYDTVYRYSIGFSDFLLLNNASYFTNIQNYARSTNGTIPDDLKQSNIQWIKEGAKIDNATGILITLIHTAPPASKEVRDIELEDTVVEFFNRVGIRQDNLPPIILSSYLIQRDIPDETKFDDIILQSIEVNSSWDSIEQVFDLAKKRGGWPKLREYVRESFPELYKYYIQNIVHLEKDFDIFAAGEDTLGAALDMF